MPEIKYYEVIQTRKIRVAANTPEDAMIVSSREFAKESKVPPIVPESEIWGHPTSPAEITSIDIRKELY